MDTKPPTQEVSKNIRIDYSKYDIDEVVGTIADAIVFPFYIGKVALKVVLIGLLLIFGLGYFSTNHWILTFLFTLFAFIISSPSLVLISVIALTNTLIKDIHNVIQISIETTKHIYQDSGLLKEQRQSGLPLQKSFTDVFRGVSLYIVRPSLKRVFSKKLGRLAFPITFLIDGIFKYIIIKKQPNFEVSISENYNNTKEIEVKTDIEGHSFVKGSKTFTKYIGRIIKFPIYLILGIFGIINVLFIWLLVIIL